MDPIQITEWESKIRSRWRMRPHAPFTPSMRSILRCWGVPRSRRGLRLGYFIPDEPMMGGGSYRRRQARGGRAGSHSRVLESHLRRLGGALPLRRAAARRRQDLPIRGSHGARQNHDRRWPVVNCWHRQHRSPLSLRGNFEINMEVYSGDFARVMERIFKVG